MPQILDTLLLTALPASGKSEVRRYLASLSEVECRDTFHLGPTVQLDDFPYVHMMRRIDQELERMDVEPIFFAAQDKPFKDGIEWGTLIELINEDYRDLRHKTIAKPASAAKLLLERFERARLTVGGREKLNKFDSSVRDRLCDQLESEARSLLDEKHANYPDTLEGKTVVIEFARGGKQGSTFPLKAPYGYGYSFSCLSDEILARASILYIWVTPEESRRKNEARTDPNDPGSILHHGVPHEVMIQEYGCDDMEFLMQSSGAPGRVTVTARGKTYSLPIGRFDNRVDKTSFIREEPRRWKQEDLAALSQGLKVAFDTLAARE